jgi:hypothetical protein
MRTVNLNRLSLPLALAVVLVAGPAMAVEEPHFRTALRDGAFEVRDYPELVVAEVTVTGSQKDAANKGFRLLAAYIFGANTRRQAVAMTAPVAQKRVGEKIAMTAPVAQTEVDGTWVVRFTMPSAYRLESLPEPENRTVQLRRVAPERVAVLRFSGLASPRDVDARTADLLSSARSHHLRTVGAVTLAQYNPPWTPWFMRRNEVMVAVEP